MHLARNLETIRRQPGGAALAARLRPAGHPVTLAAHPWPELPPGPLLLAGATDPAGIRRALDGREVWVWDRSPPLLRALLDAEDWADALRTGKLRFFSDLDLLDLRLPEGMTVVPHPLLAARYAHELAQLGKRADRWALVVEGGLMVEETTRALRARGLGVWTWEITRSPPEELDRIADTLRPELIVSINHHPGLPEAVEALTRRFATRLEVWEIDPAIDPIRPPRSPVPHTTIHSWRRANVPVYEKAGYRADWLPLASDPEWRRPLTLTPAEQERYGAPVTFVGRSMVLEARAFQKVLVERIARLRPDAAAALEGVIAEQRRTPDTWRIPELLAARIPELGATQSREADPVMLAGEIAAAEYRLTVIANLGRQGIHVWGDEGWRGLERHGVRWRGPAGHREELPRIYSNGGVHIDIGRLYQLDIVTLRVFDVLACGGFLLAQHNADLEELFVVGEELETWKTIAELREKVEAYQRDPDARRRIAARGRERVLHDHTIAQRMERFIGGAPPP